MKTKKTHLSTWKRKAFTLVELIIVITILAILATLAFMSFQGYMKDSRDAVRVSDMTNVSKGLTIFFTKAGVYPETESGITLTASGIPIGYQWYLWQSVVRAINMNQVPLDPVDQTRYIYSTSAWKTRYQLMAYTENSNLVSLLPQSYAIDYSERGLAFQWDELGVVLNNDNSLPTINVETASGSSNFKVLFDKTTKTEWSGNLLFSQIYNMRDDLIGKKELASLDNSLVAYWDMETLTGNLLKDWSKYENHGTCYNGASIVNCGITGSWPQLVNWLTSNGKALNFDGVDDWISIWISKFALLPTNDFTISSIFNTTQDVWQRCIISTSWDGSAWFRYWFWGWSTSSYIWYAGWSYAWPPFSWWWEWYPWKIKINDGKNHNLVARFLLNNKVEIFVDGIYVWKQDFVPTWWEKGALNKSQYFNIWTVWGYYPNYHTNGIIDEVRIYNRALSDSEIKALHSATK